MIRTNLYRLPVRGGETHPRPCDIDTRALTQILDGDRPRYLRFLDAVTMSPLAMRSLGEAYVTDERKDCWRFAQFTKNRARTRDLARLPGFGRVRTDFAAHATQTWVCRDTLAFLAAMASWIQEEEAK